MLCVFLLFLGWGDFFFLLGNVMCFIFFGFNLFYVVVFILLVIGLLVFVIIVCFVRVKFLIEMNKCIKLFMLVIFIVFEEIDLVKILFVVVIMIFLCWFLILLFFLLVVVGIEMLR